MTFRRLPHHVVRYFTAALAALLMLGAAVPDASAQFGGIFGGKSGNGRGNRGDSSGATRSGSNERVISAAPDQNSYEQIEYRLSLMQDDLKLSAEQTGAWQAFAAKVRVYAGDLARDRARNMRGTTSGNAPGSGQQHVSLAVDAARNRLAALEDLESSTKAFYLVLTTEQKTLADARIITFIEPRTPGAPVAPGNRAGNNLPDMGPDQNRPR